MGQRCEGNSACVPICPVMAKYNALRSLYSVDPKRRENLTIVAQTIATRIEIGPDEQVSGILCSQYDDETVGVSNTVVAKGRRYVIAAHAIETAKLLLASKSDKYKNGVANSSGKVGRNIMDHHYFLTWGLAPKNARLGVLRGPQITSEVPMRDGAFRKTFAAFRGDIRNGGWDFCAFAPYSNVATLVDKGLFGAELREQLYADVGRQISFGWQIEQLPHEDNRVTISEEYKDQLGNYRPVISYHVDDYSKRAIAEAKHLSDAILERVKGEDKTAFTNPNAAGLVTIPASLTPDGKDITVEVFGAGHIVGTHRMGKKGEEKISVCDGDCRTWDHRNLFLVSGGSMPTLGTSNPTLTIAALACKAAAAIAAELAS
jgi:choline dehydrogenase-like flavoprotein